MDSSLCQWNLDSGFHSFVGFRIPKPRILDSTSIPESGFPYMGGFQSDEMASCSTSLKAVIFCRSL